MLSESSVRDRTVPRMSTDFHFRLPDWPPQRLLAEAIMAVNLRHLDAQPLDPATSPWPLVCSAVLAYLRHNLTAYDERLRTRCEHDPEYRDDLAVQVAAAAYRKYRWLRNDPRPFPEQQDDGGPPQLFTEIARDLAHDHGVRDQVVSAIRDLKRDGKLEQAKALKITLAKIEKRIERGYAILTAPKYSYDDHGGGGSSRIFSCSHPPEEMGQYCFFDGRPVTPNRYHFLGFRCQECNAPVVRLKQPANWGQGVKMAVHSCFCLTKAVVCPPTGKRLVPLTLKEWAC